MSKNSIGGPHQADTSHDEDPVVDAREQGLRILARIIARKHLRDMSFSKKKAGWDSPSYDPMKKTLSNYEEDSGEDLS